jgi:type I restriction enzyme M protein
MFIERYWELLRPGGRLITVIDDTLLASGQDVFASIRNYIRDKFIIRAIISLPGDTFRRSGARVKTSVLVLEKKRNPKDTQPSCFTFFSECIGVDDLTPRASESDIQEARSKAEQETDAILSGYKAYLSGAKGAHLLSPELIQDRLDLKYCFPQFGRLADDWESRGIDVKPLSECVEISPDVVIPFENPDAEFTLIKVTYAGRCEVDKTKLGRAIKAPIMYRVLQGQMVFSTIRATDGAIGIVPEEMDGALVSGSYTVFDCNSPEETAYLWAILRSHEIRADMQSLSPGSGRYTTPWPEVGCVLIPWHHDRKKIGKDLIAAWKMEKKVEAMRQSALSQVEGLGVESSDSIQRFRASKAPT